MINCKVNTLKGTCTKIFNDFFIFFFLGGGCHHRERGGDWKKWQTTKNNKLLNVIKTSLFRLFSLFSQFWIIISNTLPRNIFLMYLYNKIKILVVKSLFIKVKLCKILTHSVGYVCSTPGSWRRPHPQEYWLRRR